MEELYNLYTSPHVVRVTREDITYKIFVRDIWRKRPFGDLSVVGMVI
jgi:hypothetical protein